MVILLAGAARAEEPVSLTGFVEDVPTVKVVTTGRKGDECLAPIEITRIDGMRQAVSAQGFMIEPGLHRLNGRVLLDTTRCWPLDENQHIPPAADLEVDFEVGKVYYLAYDRSHPDANRWQLVVWKVEQGPLLQPDLNDAPILPEAGAVQ